MFIPFEEKHPPPFFCVFRTSEAFARIFKAYIKWVFKKWTFWFQGPKRLDDFKSIQDWSHICGPKVIPKFEVSSLWSLSSPLWTLGSFFGINSRDAKQSDGGDSHVVGCNEWRRTGFQPFDVTKTYHQLDHDVAPTSKSLKIRLRPLEKQRHQGLTHGHAWFTANAANQVNWIRCVLMNSHLIWANYYNS